MEIQLDTQGGLKTSLDQVEQILGNLESILQQKDAASKPTISRIVQSRLGKIKRKCDQIINSDKENINTQNLTNSSNSQNSEGGKSDANDQYQLDEEAEVEASDQSEDSDLNDDSDQSEEELWEVPKKRQRTSQKAFAAQFSTPNSNKGKKPQSNEEKAAKMRAMAVRQIKQQLKWKNSCRYGSARWSYEQMCDSVDLFKEIFGLDKNRGTKMTSEEFQTKLGDNIYGSARYDTLYIQGDVNVVWKGDLWKASGKYGK